MTLAAAWCVVALAAAALASRWRRSIARLCALAVGVAAALVLAIPLTGDFAPRLFASAATTFIATMVLSILSILLVGIAAPRLVSRRDRFGAAVVFAATAVMYAAVAMFLIAPAVEEMQVAELTQVRTRDDFVAARDAGHRPGGLLVQAVVSGRTPTFEHTDVVASYSCLSVGERRVPIPGQRLPAEYLLDLPGGPPVISDGIGSGGQAWAWPTEGSGECVLRRGDPVVVWGDLQRYVGGGSTSATGVTNVRIIAVGDVASFLDGYVPAAERTGRAVLALAALNALLALVLAGVGVRTYLRLARAGTDAPPRITWRTGPR